MAKQNIVIVGAGGAGLAVASVLAAKIDSSRYTIVVISPRDRHFVMPALIRTVVTGEGKLEESALIPLQQMLPNRNAKILIGKVVAVEDDGVAGSGGNVVLENGEKVAYKFLVLATGTLFEGPLNFPASYADIVSHVNEWRKKFAQAKSIALVGGGTVGLEFSGEIKDFYPNKKVTIIHSGDLPLNGTYPDKFRKETLKRFEARKVQFILGDRIDEVDVDAANGLRTVKGRTVDADLVIPTRGGRPNTEFLKNLGNGVLDANGNVKIRPTLQLESYPDIFAVGDIISFAEQKQLAKVPGHAGVAAANILALTSGKEPKKFYKGTFEAVLITNGRTHGNGYMALLWGLLVGDKVVSMLKSKDLFVSNTRKTYGIKA